MNYKFVALVMLCSFAGSSFAQTLHLPDALNRSIQNYEKIKTKDALIKASEQTTKYQESQHLPDLTLMAQQNFGTINAQNGPLYSYGGLGVASTSMPLAEQNWNAAFGSLYLANINWNIFTFGRIKNQVRVSRAGEAAQTMDLAQEVFSHQIKVAGAYFNLLASQRIKYVQEKNLERTKVFLATTISKAASGLIPEVEASLAKAEVSNAQSARIKAYDKELEYAKQLAVLLGEPFHTYQLDTIFNHKVPKTDSQAEMNLQSHPLLRYQKSIVDQHLEEEKLQRSSIWPSLSAFGVVQGRGSGFDWNYVQDNSAYSKSYTDGVGINRSNYVVGLTLSWNITNVHRNSLKYKARKFITSSIQHDYKLLNQELAAQVNLAEHKLKNAYEIFNETQIQLQAAKDAFAQHTALYENGLSTIVDFTQYLYALNRAEIDHEIAQTNTWQALLLKAAAEGDLNLLMDAIKS